MSTDELDALRAFIESASSDELRDSILAAATDEAKLRAFVSLAESAKVQLALEEACQRAWSDESCPSAEALIRTFLRMAAVETAESEGLVVGKTKVPREMYKIARDVDRRSERVVAAALQDLSRKGVRCDPMDVEAMRAGKLSRIFEDEADVLEDQNRSTQSKNARAGHQGATKQLVAAVLRVHPSLTTADDFIQRLTERREWPAENGLLIEVEQLADDRWEVICPKDKARDSKAQPNTESLKRAFRRAREN